MTTGYDAILFDFDGVLADSEPVHYACWREVLTDLDIDLDWEQFATTCVGLSERGTCEFFLAHARKPVPLDEVMSRYPQKQALVRARMTDCPPVFPATLDFFGELKSYKLAVVSSSGHAEIDPVLKAAGLWPRLATVICGEDVVRHKPAPDPYLKAAAILDARNPLVVEDSEIGEQSGRAAGFDVLRITSAETMADVLRRFLDGDTVSL